MKRKFTIKDNIVIGINLCDEGSSGIIMRNALEYANNHGAFDYLVIATKDVGKPNTFAFLGHNSFVDKIDRRLFHRTIGNPDGLYEYRATKRIIKKINEMCNQYNKVIIHLHNLHMASIDFRVLFRFLAKKDSIKNIFYTIHDCWPFTGGCYCYKYVGCDDWLTGCRNKCVQNYGNIKIGTSLIYDLKKKYTLPLINKMTLFPVSEWLSNEIDKSFLKIFKKDVINGETNIINLGYKDKELIDKLLINNKKIVLTVSYFWDPWKGGNYIYDIAKKLPSNYVIIVVGFRFDVKGSDKIIHVGVMSPEQLSHYYSIADVYVSTSQSESLGLTTCEAQICGVPVVAFGHTGIKETFTEKTGIMVGEDNDIDKMTKAIVKVVEEKPFKKEDIIKNGNRFSKYSSSKKYYTYYLKAIGRN